MTSRRSFLKISTGIIALLGSGLIFQNFKSLRVKHILASASHEKLALSVSLSKKTSRLDLVLNNQKVNGTQVDSLGTNWQFISPKLESNTAYKLQLLSEDEAIYKPWEIKTFPSPHSEVENVSITSLAFLFYRKLVIMFHQLAFHITLIDFKITFGILKQTNGMYP